jgi:acetyl esterase/lipase
VTVTASPQTGFTPVIEPHTRQWLDGLAAASAGSPPPWELSPADARQLLHYVLDTGDYQRHADGPSATREAMRWFWDSYLPDQSRRAEITASPLQASIDQMRGLPRALIINGEHDVLRDEGEAYARKLSQAGVPVTQVRYGGTIHDFVLLNPITGTPRRGQPSRGPPATCAAS